MLKFLDYVTEEKERHAVVAFGRMNPPTTGHEALVNKVKEHAAHVGGDAHVYLSHSQDAKKKVIDLDTYNALDQWAITLNEMYKSLRKAGFAVDLSLAIITDRDAYPDWILPTLPNRIDNIPYDDDDED